MRRRYRNDSLVLETEFHTRGGSVRVIDFMPVSDERWDVVRIVEGLTGTVAMRMELIVRFDYGSIIPWVRRSKDILLLTAGPDTLELAASVDVCGENMKTVAQFSLRKGQHESFVLNYRPSHFPTRPRIDPSRALKATERLAPLVGALPIPGTMARGGPAIADHPEGSDLRADRRPRGRAHHVAAGVAGGRSQLGLSLLLAARRDLHLEFPAAGRLQRRGLGVARMVVAGGRRLAG